MAQNPNGNHNANLTEVQILTVDRESEWTSFLGKALGKAGLVCHTVTDADAAIEVLSREDMEITSVITDGLRGKWPQVAEAAIEAGAMPVLVTRSSFPLSGAAEMGVPTYGKQELKNNSLALERMLKVVTP